MCEDKHKKMSDRVDNLFPQISLQEALKIINEADTTFDEQKFRRAIRLYSQALNAPLSDLDKGYILYMRGKAFYEIGDTERACHQWLLAIGLELTHPTGMDLVQEEYERHCT